MTLLAKAIPINQGQGFCPALVDSQGVISQASFGYEDRSEALEFAVSFARTLPRDADASQVLWVKPKPHPIPSSNGPNDHALPDPWGAFLIGAWILITVAIVVITYWSGAPRRAGEAALQSKLEGFIKQDATDGILRTAEAKGALLDLITDENEASSCGEHYGWHHYPIGCAINTQRFEEKYQIRVETRLAQNLKSPQGSILPPGLSQTEAAERLITVRANCIKSGMRPSVCETGLQ